MFASELKAHDWTLTRLRGLQNRTRTVPPRAEAVWRSEYRCVLFSLLKTNKTRTPFKFAFIFCQFVFCVVMWFLLLLLVLFNRVSSCSRGWPRTHVDSPCVCLPKTLAEGMPHRHIRRHALSFFILFSIFFFSATSSSGSEQFDPFLVRVISTWQEVLRQVDAFLGALDMFDDQRIHFQPLKLSCTLRF